MSTLFDIAIIGGGPAGLAAAQRIAKQDLSVVVFEEHDTIGEPLACGEGISVAKLYELALIKKGTPLESCPFVQRFVPIQRFFFGDNSVCTSRLETVLINRVHFDRTLANNAEMVGAEIRTGCSVKKLHFSSNSVGVEFQSKETSKKEKVDARIIIACDGSASRCVKQVFPNVSIPFVQAMEYKIKGIFTDALEFYFNHKLTPWGYGWVFPKENETNIGIAVQPGENSKEKLNQFVKRVYGTAGRARAKVLKEIAGNIPTSGPLRQTVADRFLVAGDAGGFTNSIFYGGIAIAIHTGRLAADVAVHAIQGKTETLQTLQSYEEQWRQMPYANPAIQRAHRVFYHEFGTADIENIGMLLDNLDIERMGIGSRLRIGWRLLRNRISYSKFKHYKQVTEGFAISRDWGF
ncbi:MAG: NAD(P)/FAD-dependent oxidoreductase [Candidatus Heimdallarchaeota archaeon]